MSVAVDVLAVLKDRAAYLREEGYDWTADQLLEARAVVAELIEAGNAWCDLMPGLAGGPEFDRLKAALANIRSAP